MEICRRSRNRFRYTIVAPLTSSRRAQSNDTSRQRRRTYNAANRLDARESVYRHSCVHVRFLLQCLEDPSILTCKWTGTLHLKTNIRTKHTFAKVLFKQECYRPQELDTAAMQRGE